MVFSLLDHDFLLVFILCLDVDLILLFISCLYARFSCPIFDKITITLVHFD
jgi:hypothetical protein